MATAVYNFNVDQEVYYLKNNRIHKNTVKSVGIGVFSDSSTRTYVLQNDAVKNEDDLYGSVKDCTDFLTKSVVDDND